MNQLFKKLFCLHAWRSHAKEQYEWTEEEVVAGTEHWMQPKLHVQTYTKVVEILICEHCGRVKRIEY